MKTVATLRVVGGISGVLRLLVQVEGSFKYLLDNVSGWSGEGVGMVFRGVEGWGSMPIGKIPDQ
jgi:hypothetical protein